MKRFQNTGSLLQSKRGLSGMIASAAVIFVVLGIVLSYEHFICIKVDREERPDLDEIYMTATQLMTRHGGWPNSVFLTPDLKPFFAGTYFGPTD